MPDHSACGQGSTGIPGGAGVDAKTIFACCMIGALLVVLAARDDCRRCRRGAVAFQVRVPSFVALSAHAAADVVAGYAKCIDSTLLEAASFLTAPLVAQLGVRALVVVSAFWLHLNLFAIVGAGADKARWAGTGNNPLAIVGVCHRAL